jgi:hypothetical protein
MYCKAGMARPTVALASRGSFNGIRRWFCLSGGSAETSLSALSTPVVAVSPLLAAFGFKTGFSDGQVAFRPRL